MSAPAAPIGSPEIAGARAWLADSVEASAVSAAEEVFAGLVHLTADGAQPPGDLARHVEQCGLDPLLAWADAVALAGLADEPWARTAALRAVQAYRDRLAELMDASGAEDRL